LFKIELKRTRGVLFVRVVRFDETEGEVVIGFSADEADHFSTAQLL